MAALEPVDPTAKTSGIVVDEHDVALRVSARKIGSGDDIAAVLSEQRKPLVQTPIVEVSRLLEQKMFDGQAQQQVLLCRWRRRRHLCVGHVLVSSFPCG